MRTVTKIPPGDPTTALNRHRRNLDRAYLSEGHAVDVLVIGGGVTGAGVALDAASRGLSVALVEREDLASGTSSWSSKLIHGGLRYLAKGDFGVAWESAIERKRIATRIAPHLIHPMGQLGPIFADDRASGYLTGVGFMAGDMLRVASGTPRGMLPGTRRIPRSRALELAPTVRTQGLRGAMLGWDCQLEDDARFVVTLARTAAAFGARILTRTEVITVNSTGADVRDTQSGESYQIRAKHVINATGVWAGAIDPGVTLTPSLGTHVVVRSERLGNARVSLTVPVPNEFGRFLFTLPQADGVTYIGLTDNALSGQVPRSVTAPGEDVSWLVDTISSALEAPIRLTDVIGSFAGMRPLVVPRDQEAGVADASADISRKHYVHREDNLVTITGGKFTTYRRMASDAVDLISERPCRTTDIALVGAGPRPTGSGVPDRLWRRYGNEAPLVWALGDHDPSLREPVAEHIPTLGVEFAFGTANEMALTESDLLDRRSRLGLVAADADLARPVADRLIAEVPA